MCIRDRRNIAPVGNDLGVVFSFVVFPRRWLGFGFSRGMRFVGVLFLRLLRFPALLMLFFIRQRRGLTVERFATVQLVL